MIVVESKTAQAGIVAVGFQARGGAIAVSLERSSARVRRQIAQKR